MFNINIVVLSCRYKKIQYIDPLTKIFTHLEQHIDPIWHL